MKAIEDYSDQRHKGACIHCDASLAGVENNLDHVPSKSILDRPYPQDLPTIRICRMCNTSFSNDEEYFIAFLGSVLAGTTDPERQTVERVRQTLRKNQRLQREIAGQREIVTDLFGNDEVNFFPESSRIENVVIKNARGHVLFEHGQHVEGEPARVVVQPLLSMQSEQLAEFESIDYGQGWPEVGSRLMSRLLSGNDMRSDGWVVVQPDVYRFAVMDHGMFIVRTVVREYLATEVAWES